MSATEVRAPLGNDDKRRAVLPPRRMPTLKWAFDDTGARRGAVHERLPERVHGRQIRVLGLLLPNPT